MFKKRMLFHPFVLLTGASPGSCGSLRKVRASAVGDDAGDNDGRDPLSPDPLPMPDLDRPGAEHGQLSKMLIRILHLLQGHFPRSGPMQVCTRTSI